MFLNASERMSINFLPAKSSAKSNKPVTAAIMTTTIIEGINTSLFGQRTLFASLTTPVAYFLSPMVLPPTC